MSRTIWALYRVVLAAYVAVGSLIALGTPPGGVNAAHASTWHWQNPLPRGYSMSAVACRSLTACIAVGQGGSIATTNDGGQHWTDRASRTTTDLWSVACPGQAVCYATGYTGYPSGPSSQVVHPVILKSADGGATWRQPAAHLPISPHQTLSSLACPSVTTCLVGGGDTTPPERFPILRTTDGGRTWQPVHIPGLQNLGFVTCATVTVCYALVAINNRSRLLRSADGGTSWTARGLHPPTGLVAMACSQENACFATVSNCGAECSEGDVFLTRDSAKTWKELAHKLIEDQLQTITCPNATTCYAHGAESVVRSANGGKTWSIRHLPDPASDTQGADMACPSPTACYVAAGFTVLRTRDGFDHNAETLARSAIHDLELTSISCSSTASCYAVGSRTIFPGGGPGEPAAAPLAVTSDGGRTWRETRQAPQPFTGLSCLSTSVCYAIAPSRCCTPPRLGAAIYRSGDGAKTWKGKTVRQIVAPLVPETDSPGPYISCATVTTCYVTATLLKAESTSVPPILSVLVTRNGGRTWGVRTRIDTAVRASAPHQYSPPTLDAISCPRVMTCFVVGSVSSGAVFLSTTDGAMTWRRHRLPSGGRWGPLACPTGTTCAEVLFPLPSMRLPASLAAIVLVTHDAGVSWHRTVFSTHRSLYGIACATGQACRVVGEGGIFGTEDSGRTWQRQLMANGKGLPYLARIACPAVDTCYAVGGVTIVATHL